MGTVKLRNINKSYGTMQALSDVSLDIEEGSFVVFVGPSGCGKSTLLRTIAGLENISSGEIFIAERDVTDVAPAERSVSMVFQSYALYPHMTARQNMEFGMKVNKVAPDERAKRVCEVARILQLNDYLDRKPSQLSGGQRQRVAIGRAIVRDPDVFLFDEPLSNLDAKLRMQMRVELQALHRELKATMIYVTHDQVEAMTMADIIVVLNAGRIEQVGSPMELYHRPVSKFVAEFIGSPAMNVFSLDTSMTLQGIVLQPSTHFIGCRPEHFEICPGEKATLNATIKVKEQLGGESLLHAAVSCDLNVVISTNGDDQTAVGDTIGLQIPERRLHQFDQDGCRLN